MAELLLYKNPYIFDRLQELNLPSEEELATYQIAFLANTGMGVDRTRNSVFNYRECGIPNYLTDKSFEQIMYERALELKNSNEMLTVMLSGSFSIAVLKALRSVNANIKVLTTQQDVDARGHVYVDLLRNVNTTVLDKYEMNNSDNYTGKIITGDCGELLFDYMLTPWFIGKKKTLDKKRLFLSSIVFDIFKLGAFYSTIFKDSHALSNFYTNKDYAFDVIKQKLLELISRSPVPIENTFDLYWWLSFSLKWYSRKYRFIGITGRYVDVEPFYCTDDFQSWSIVNHDNKSREIIHSYTGISVEKSTSNVVNLNGRDTTWKLSFADSTENTANEPVPVTLEMVRNILK